MKRISNPIRRAALAAAIAAVVALPVQAADYPTQTVRMVVPYAAGGTSDIVGRGLAAKLSERLGKPVIIDNKAGAGGAIGTEAVVRSAPDGHTLLFHSGAIATERALKKDMSYDVRKDLAPIMMVVVGPFAVLVHPSVPAKSVAELIAYAKANPGKINFGTPGHGTSVHMATELFKSMAAVDITHVPYKGAAPALTALTAGQIQLVIDPLATAKPFGTSGKVRALAVTVGQRTGLWPELPTVAESGLPGYETGVWYGLFAPAGTPKAVVDKVNAEMRAVLAAPDIKEWMTKMGVVAVGDRPEEFRKRLNDEIERWTKVVEQAGIKTQ